MTKLRNYVTAVIAALVLALLCLMPTFISAYASGGGPTEDTYQDLYYFSDNEKCSQRFNNFVSIYNNEYATSIQGHLIDWSCDGDTQDSISEISFYISENDGLGEIENSFVIFEISNESNLAYFLGYQEHMSAMMHQQADYNNLLYNNFSQLKADGCKIMFICAFDEAKFKSHNAFLDYVDIHINTGLFENFMYNVLYRVKNRGQENERMNNRTIIFEKSLSSGIYENGASGQALNNEYFRNYFYRYLISAYREELSQNNEMYSLLKNCNINFLFYLGDGKFYDGVEDEVLSYDGYGEDYYIKLKEYLNNEKVYVVGTSWYSVENFVELYSIIKYVDLDYGVDADIEFLIYNPANYPYESIFSYSIKTEGANLGWFEQTLSDIVSDFICGDDLNIYNNWDGRCEITYKPVTFDPNGWFYNFHWNRENSPAWLELFSDDFEMDDLATSIIWKV